ncbi:uncharacterized protein LOC128682825 [Plodia interpunctella]|uniref:uncharacterized protein LOC128682825 n=1 Tax=Plodia interpunctella TaxID=58824 RepID=UPI002368567E|nr:uncharacterized protein LOC128682825 [Plodia interpunctella]XP_053623693.1 uncharacterized protein LOC128682825 [Plodia interpunctella]XP_053623694.1 uncharacterized protein LOC128682825 [Plodia interpunctella]
MQVARFASIVEKRRSKMDYAALILLITCAQARMVCERNKMALELGKWKNTMIHMDSAVVENSPVAIAEGQIYVYENYFPGYTIRYIHVDNLAQKTCGASAQIKDGGIGKNSVLVVLRAESNLEIRSVVDVWGTKDPNPRNSLKLPRYIDENAKYVKSLYLYQGSRALNHNKGF